MTWTLDSSFERGAHWAPTASARGSSSAFAAVRTGLRNEVVESRPSLQHTVRREGAMDMFCSGT